METPEFIIAVPTYNRSNLISRVVDSVVKQTYSNWLLLFMDDASTDDTREVIEQYQSRYPEKIEYRCLSKNSGVNKARNQLITAAKEIDERAFIVWLDDDDYLTETCLTDAAESIRSNPQYDWYTMDCIREDGNSISKMSQYGELSYIDDYMFGKRMKGDMTHIVRLSAIVDEKFTDEFRNAEVWYFWVLLAKRINLYAINKVGSVKEYLPEGISKSGFNRSRSIEVLKLKIRVLEPLVGKEKMICQYVSLAREFRKSGKKDQSRNMLKQAFEINPLYIRQYLHWVKLLF
ncbi:MAG: hypothetical protein CMI02_04280 [Oceanospirillaceae bacterium]|nr:hypothetical protein [Oceanospirillaceae bacterium]MBT11235.1 hypothetical protein [Oceanospirillaceae bacterium]|tara:strand:+ start:85956 stop:86825 length:870 start_codon:yes stop_codon:yes gene_type:complete